MSIPIQQVLTPVPAELYGNGFQEELYFFLRLFTDFGFICFSVSEVKDVCICIL